MVASLESSENRDPEQSFDTSQAADTLFSAYQSPQRTCTDTASIVQWSWDLQGRPESYPTFGGVHNKGD